MWNPSPRQLRHAVHSHKGSSVDISKCPVSSQDDSTAFVVFEYHVITSLGFFFLFRVMSQSSIIHLKPAWKQGTWLTAEIDRHNADTSHTRPTWRAYIELEAKHHNPLVYIWCPTKQSPETVQTWLCADWLEETVVMTPVVLLVVFLSTAAVRPVRNILEHQRKAHCWLKMKQVPVFVAGCHTRYTWGWVEEQILTQWDAWWMQKCWTLFFSVCRRVWSHRKSQPRHK